MPKVFGYDKKRTILQGPDSKVFFIPSLGSKRLFLDKFEKMTDEEKQEAEVEKLEQSFDTFPLDVAETENEFRVKWVKWVMELRSPMYISTSPDFIEPELFFKVMNGFVPKESRN